MGELNYPRNPPGGQEVLVTLFDLPPAFLAESAPQNTNDSRHNWAREDAAKAKRLDNKLRCRFVVPFFD